MVRAVIVGIALLILPLARAQTERLNRGVSTSRQFICYAANPLLPASLGYFAEQVKREWLYTLDAPDEWRDPVVLLVTARSDANQAAASPALRVFQTDLHLKYQVTWLTPPGLEQPTVVLAIVESLCAELANRNEDASVAKPYRPAPVPHWLTYGLARVIQGRDERLVQLARRSRVEGQLPNVTLLLASQLAPTTPVERDLFEANAWVLVQSLLALPDGAPKLRQFLTGLGKHKQVAAAFWETYRGDFTDEAGLARWWAVQFAARTTTVVAENFTGEETSRRLTAILSTTLAPSTTNASARAEIELPLADLARYSEAPWLHDVVQEKLARLANLLSQACPSYRPAVEAYSEALQWLLQENRVRFRRGIARADKVRAQCDKQDRDLRAYLDAAELKYAPADGAPDFSGAFRTLSDMETLERTRRSPISEYLDQFDK